MSESRFIICPRTDKNIFITQKTIQNYAATQFSSRDPKNGYQKIVIKRLNGYSCLRFDHHPQPYLGILDNKLCLFEYPTELTYFTVFLFEKRKLPDGEWSSIDPEDGQLNFEASEGFSFKAAFFHIHTKSFLSFNKINKTFEVVPVPLEFNLNEIDKSSFHYNFGESLWCLEAVAKNWRLEYGTVAEIIK
ncbi:hypothetical protein HDU92_000125 [Lobulomyces angularis]|nr:hypothetical protein HDU92_000125 [Lobulomyces angularis]